MAGRGAAPRVGRRDGGRRGIRCRVEHHQHAAVELDQVAHRQAAVALDGAGHRGALAEIERADADA
jgi:hypothetical protein